MKVAAATRCARSEAQKHTGSRSGELTGFAWSHSADFEVCNSANRANSAVGRFFFDPTVMLFVCGLDL